MLNSAMVVVRLAYWELKLIELIVPIVGQNYSAIPNNNALLRGRFTVVVSVWVYW